MIKQWEIWSTYAIYSIRDKPVTTAIAEGHFYLKKNVDDDIELDTNTDLGMQYYHQMQGNMHLSGRSKCDLVSWTPLEMYSLSCKESCLDRKI